MKDSEDRLAADVLLGAPWLLRNGAESIDASERIVRAWLVEKGLSKRKRGGGDEEAKK